MIPEEQADLFLFSAMMAIRRHHGQLKDFSDTFDQLHDDNAAEQIDAIDMDGVKNYCQKVSRAVGVAKSEFRIPSQTELRRSYRKKLRRLGKNETFREFVNAGLLYSLLVWADKIDAATCGEASIPTPFQISSHLVDQYRTDKFGEPKDELSKLRCKVSKDVERTFLDNIDCNLFTLTAPTGSAKTLAILNAALKARNTIGEGTGTRVPRIIYCLPFTSIIDQNHEVFADVLNHNHVQPTDDILLKAPSSR